ncbi:phosphotransferase [Virgibacillus oceani]|uniref:Aminoglycoside phosphotransferase n=1 Tax=Virgibacillus oceani TaxID=1479511 RepID=A0A917M7Y5_9BACI|nr:phosphotransferase [Virgibacillus oceani]GGG83516.1 aminoglycoside phosphotransferase [Virgibacillus oceani]
MTEKEMIDYIKISFPDLKINAVQVNRDGWDNTIIIINQEIVFRFPKNNDIAWNVVVETKLLKGLHKLEPEITIPDYTILRDENDELKCVYYRFIKGVSVKEGRINLTKKNAQILGDFLTKLHSMKPDLKLNSVQTPDYWNNLYHSVHNKIFPYLNEKQKNEINDTFLSFLNSNFSSSIKKSVIHGDLTASNIICDGSGMINGIIDFTDAQLGDPAFDFAGFYWNFGPDFTKDVLSYYNGAESAESLYTRVKSFYGLQPIFHELLYAIQHDITIDWETALKKFFKLKGNG